MGRLRTNVIRVDAEGGSIEVNAENVFGGFKKNADFYAFTISELDEPVNGRVIALVARCTSLPSDDVARTVTVAGREPFGRTRLEACCVRRAGLRAFPTRCHFVFRFS